MKYGIELEFFVTKNNNIVPAYKATYNLDGNPVVGELRTGIFDSIEECIFDLKRLIYQEESSLHKKGFGLLLKSEVTVNDNFIRNLRRDRRFVDYKNKEYTEELSIYGEAETSILNTNKFKASLQINFSRSTQLHKTTSGRRIYGGLMFDYVDIIRKLDVNFKEEIKTTKRVKGIYAIKSGEISNRIEYRSLPNNVDLFKIIELLK